MSVFKQIRLTGLVLTSKGEKKQNIPKVIWLIGGGGKR